MKRDRNECIAIELILLAYNKLKRVTMTKKANMVMKKM